MQNTTIQNCKTVSKYFYVTVIAIICNYCVTAQCNYYSKIDLAVKPHFHQIIINSPDSCYFVNYTNDSLFTGANARIAKLNKFGDTLWTKQFCDKPGTITSLVISHDSTLVVCGGSGCKDSIGRFPFLCKLDLNGNLISKVYIGDSAGNFAPKTMILTAQNNFVVAGDSYGPIDNVYMFDSNLNLIQTATCPMHMTNDVVQGKNGDLFFCGGDWGPSDAWAVMSYDSTLTNYNWIHYYGNDPNGNWGDWFFTIFVMPDSNLLVSGGGPGIDNFILDPQSGNVIDTLQATPTFNKFIQYNDSVIVGKNDWYGLVFFNTNTLDTIKHVGGWLGANTIQTVFDMVINNAGCFTVLGAKAHNYGIMGYYTDSSFFVIFGDTVKLNLGNEEIKTDIELNLSVYPNPSQEKTVVEFENATKELLNYTLCDIQGRVILSATTKENFIELHKNNNDAGVYFISIKNKDGSVLGRGKILWN